MVNYFATLFENTIFLVPNFKTCFVSAVFRSYVTDVLFFGFNVCFRPQWYIWNYVVIFFILFSVQSYNIFMLSIFITITNYEPFSDKNIIWKHVYYRLPSIVVKFLL